MLSSAALAGAPSPRWQELAGEVRVVWPGNRLWGDPLVDARITLEDQAERSSRVYLLADASNAQLALVLAAHRPGVVRAVLLVSLPRQPIADDCAHQQLVGALRSRGVQVHRLQPGGSVVRIGEAAVAEEVLRQLVRPGLPTG
ncbi:hypothetical protein [Saccharopolyspora rectivirgula]|uniref:Uncharacterized protein n=1 Tax=Saccharopolyspora rectivirgula TaxID=28042 RepID=A0A073AWU4_9PSEU|nr:hypothetical protein [Saccharopolyspora rectivirgula]KEI43801.1 hypothetical protein GU90_12420 [Saccharopolyspora rectivirgula]